MAKKIKFPLEMRDGVQARTLEELQEYFDIEKAMSYLVDGKLCTWLEDRYYMSEAETIKGIDAYASDAKEKLCSALGVELEVDAEVDVREIERHKERLAKLKQYTDDELIWEKVDQVAFNQEDLADLLDEDCKEIYLCGDKFQIPYAVKNVTYHGVGNVSAYINASGEIDLTETDIYFEHVEILNENIANMDPLERSILKRTKRIMKLYESGLEYRQEVKLLAKDVEQYISQNSQNLYKCLSRVRDLKTLCKEIDRDLENINSEEYEYITEAYDMDYEVDQQFEDTFLELETISEEWHFGGTGDDNLDTRMFITGIKKLNDYIKNAMDNQKIEELACIIYDVCWLDDIYDMIYIVCYDFRYKHDIQRNMFEVSIEFLQLIAEVMRDGRKKYPCLFRKVCRRDLPYDECSIVECDMKYLTGDLLCRYGKLTHSFAYESAGKRMMVEAVRERVETFGNSDGLLIGDGGHIIEEGKRIMVEVETGKEVEDVIYYNGSIMAVHRTKNRRIYYIENKNRATNDVLCWIKPDGTLCRSNRELLWKRGGLQTRVRYYCDVRECTSYDEILAVEEVKRSSDVWERAQPKWITINH